MNPLAQTTFSSGPQDNLAAVDVYKAAGTTINSIQDQKTASSFDISSVLANAGQGAITGVSSLLNINQKTGAVSLNYDQVTSKLNSSIPSMGPSIRELSSSAKDTLTTSFKDYGTLDVKMGDSVFQVPSSKAADVYGFGNYVNDVNLFGTSLTTASETSPGFCSVYDIDSHSTLISAGILQGSNIGIPNAVNTLMTPPAVSGNSTLLSKVTQACLPVLVKNGDLGNIAALSKTPGGQVFDAILPNYGSLLKSNYRSTGYNRNNGTSGAAVSDYQSLISIFTNTNSSWNVFARAGDSANNPTLNLLKLLGGTPAFQNLVSIGVKNLVDGDSAKQQILATMFSETDVITQLHQSFPKLVLEVDLNKQTEQNQTIDPRIVQLIGTTGKTLIGNISV